MIKKTKKLLKVFIPLLVGILLAWYSLNKMSFSTLIQYFKAVDYTWIGLGVVLGVMSHLSRGYRWKFLLNPMGYKPKLYNNLFAVFTGYLINYTIPRAGEVSRASILNTYEKIPFAKGFGTIISERIADMFMMFFIIVLALILKFDYVFNLLLNSIKLTELVIFALVLIAFLSLALIFIKKSNWSFIEKLKQFFKDIVVGALSIFKMKNKGAFVFHTVFIWTMYLLMFFVTSLAFPSLEPIPFSVLLIGFIAAGFSIVATNGGIGAYPEAIVLVFTFFGIQEDASRAFGWIMWSSHTLMVVVLGSLSLLLLPVLNNNQKNKETKTLSRSSN